MLPLFYRPAFAVCFLPVYVRNSILDAFVLFTSLLLYFFLSSREKREAWRARQNNDPLPREHGPEATRRSHARRVTSTPAPTNELRQRGRRGDEPLSRPPLGAAHSRRRAGGSGALRTKKKKKKSSLGHRPAWTLVDAAASQLSSPAPGSHDFELDRGHRQLTSNETGENRCDAVQFRKTIKSQQESERRRADNFECASRAKPSLGAENE